MQNVISIIKVVKCLRAKHLIDINKQSEIEGLIKDLYNKEKEGNDCTEIIQNIISVQIK